MTAASPLPGSRNFAGWFRQFATVHPRAILAGHFPVQSIEVLVSVQRDIRLNSLSRLLLQALPESGAISIEDIHHRMPIGLSLVVDLIEELGLMNLIQFEVTANLSLTRDGRNARDTESCPILRPTRRVFRFLDIRPGAPPLSVNADKWPLQSCPSGTPAAGFIGLDQIRELIRKSIGERREIGFPDDIVDLLELANDADDWQRTPIVRLERLTAAVVGIDSANGEREWLVYPAKPEVWTIVPAEPLIRLRSGAIPSITPDKWREAWRTWCRDKQISVEDANSCRLELAEPRLQIAFPDPLTEAIRKVRDDLRKGETWLVADRGDFRQAILIEPLG